MMEETGTGSLTSPSSMVKLVSPTLMGSSDSTIRPRETNESPLKSRFGTQEGRSRAR